MKKVVSLLMALVMLLSFASASLAEAVDYSVNEEVTLTYWMTLTDEKSVAMMQGIVDAFEAKYPNIKVDMIYKGSYAEISTALIAANVASADVPACVWTDTQHLAAFAQNGVIEDLTPYAEYYKTDLADYVPSFINACTFDGKQYAFPVGLASDVIFYNKDLLKELNLTFPTKWTEMPAYLEAVYTATGKPAMTFTCWNTFYLWPLFYNIGCEMLKLDENGKEYIGLDNDKAKALVGELLDWTKKGWIDWGTKAGNTRTAFGAKDTAGIMYYSGGVYTALRGLSDFEIGISVPVEMDPGMNYQPVSGSFFVIPSNQPQVYKNAAYLFTSYFTGAEHCVDFALGTSWLPSHLSVTSTPEGSAAYLAVLPAMQPVLESIDTFVRQTVSAADADVSKIMLSYMMQIMNEEVSLDDGWEMMLEEMNDILSDM